MTRGPRGASVANRITETVKHKTRAHVTAQFDREAAVALDVLVDRLSFDDGRTVSVSEAMRRAVLFMERATRKGEGKR